MIHSAGMSGNPVSRVSPTVTQGRNALIVSAMPAMSGMMYARMPGRNMPRKLIKRV